MSNTTASEASSVSAATEEQSSSLSLAADRVDELAGLARDLYDQVSTFNTDQTSDDVQSRWPEVQLRWQPQMVGGILDQVPDLRVLTNILLTVRTELFWMGTRINGDAKDATCRFIVGKFK